MVCAVCVWSWVGCGAGDDDPDLVDGSPADAAAAGDAITAADAARLTDAPTGLVVVRVFTDGIAVAGVPTVLQTGAGAVLAEALTDASGEASYEDPPEGAMITILQQAASTPHFHTQTIVGVQAGDVIQLGAPAEPAEPTLDVRVDYPGPFTGADIYLADLGCDTFGVADPDFIMTRSVGTSCLGSDDDYDVLALARQGTTPIAYATVRDVPVSDPGPTALVLPAWTPAESRVMTFANLAGEITDTDVSLRPVLDHLTRWPLLSTGDTFTAPAAALVDGWYVLASARAFAGGDARTWAWRQVLSTKTATPYALDFDDFGPRFDTLDLDTSDPLRPVVTWTSSAPTSTYGAVVLVATWTDLATAPDASHRWTIVMPPGTETATFPILPDSAAAFRPSATAAYQYLQIFAFWYEGQPDYTAYRNEQPFALGTPLTTLLPEEARMLLYQKDVSE